MNRFDCSFSSSCSRQDSKIGSLAFTLVSIIAAAVLLFATMVRSQNSEWTVYNTSNSGLPDKNVLALAIDNQGNKWIGTNVGGLAKFDGLNWTVHNTSNSGLPTNDIRALAIDTQKNKWIGAYGGGLVKFDGVNWTVYNTGNSGLPKNYVGALVIDAQGNKWIGTHSAGGLVKFDGVIWTVYNTGNSGLPANNILALAIDNQGNKWIGTAGGGLAKFDGMNWTVYNTDNSGLPDNRIWSLTIDTQGNKWIGTWSGGLAKFDGMNWTVYNTGNSGLPTNDILALAIDAQENKWIGTYGGGLAVYWARNAAPVADAKGPYTGYIGVPMTFDGSASSDPDGDSLSYTWDFGDGATDAGMRPWHTYADSGVYTVILTVDDGRGGTDTDTTTAQIYLPGQREILPDEHTVLLDPLDGGCKGTAVGAVNYLSSLLGLDQAANLTGDAYIRYDLTPWYHSTWDSASPTPQGSIEFWLKLKSYPITLMYFQWHLSNTPPADGYILDLSVSEEGKLHYRFWSGAPAPPEFGGKTVIPTEVWTHVAVTWGSDSTKLYVNGRVDTSVAGNGYPAMGWTPPDFPSLYVYLNGWGGELGCVDELHISEIQRSDEEILFHHNLATEVKQAASQNLPKAYCLEQNYPNPFNSVTIIQYQLPKKSWVTIKVFNLLGQAIRTLVDEQKQAGYFTAAWDGRDDNGKPVASGIYLYQIKAGGTSQRSRGDFVNTRKMLLLR